MPVRKNTNVESLDEEEVVAGSEVESEPSEETVKAGLPGTVGSIHFKIRNPNIKGGSSVRTFSSAVHGAGYQELAEQFEIANTHLTSVCLDKVKDEAEIKRIDDHNNSIKHPIIGKHVDGK
jgi:hypothetical protein